jgi:hypothetical protein
MNYWIFKANPDHYRIDDRLENPYPYITWSVTRYHERIQKGDIVLVWRAGTPRGICAIMEVDASPFEPEEEDLNDGFEIPVGSVTRGEAHWAKCRITQHFPVLEASVIKKIPGLELFSFFSAFQQAVNFSITRREGTRLIEYIKEHPPEAQPPKPAPVPRPVAKAASRPEPGRKPVPGRKLESGKKPEPVTPRSKPVKATVTSPEFTLLQCAECGSYVISSDTARHISDAHGGQPVGWKKTKK